MQFFYDGQIRRYVTQLMRLMSNFPVKYGDGTIKTVPVMYGDLSRQVAHLIKDNSENKLPSAPRMSVYITGLEQDRDRTQDATFIDKLNLKEREYDTDTGSYLNTQGKNYTVERLMPAPYMLRANVDVWTSNTDQKLQLMEQILVLFNPTLDIRTNDSPVDWTSLSHVELTNTTWSTRSVGSSIDDIIDVATLTFDIPIYITPPAKVKQQKLIHTIINELYNLDDANLDNFKDNLAFNKETLKYTVVTYENKEVRFLNNTLQILNDKGSNIGSDGLVMEWDKELLPFGVLRDGISQLRLRKGSDVNDNANDIVGRLDTHPSDSNLLNVTIDTATLPTNTLTAIDGVIDPLNNYPGDGVVPNAVIGQRYIILNDAPINALWTNVVAYKYDVIEYNGSAWTVSFDSSSNSATQYITNVSSDDQLEWNGSEWVNSYEGIYNPGYWRIYL